MTDTMELIDEVAAQIRATFVRHRRGDPGENADGAATLVVAHLMNLAWNPQYDLLAEAARRVHYISSYCVDGLHGDCRLTCKNCEQACRCRCHSGDPHA